MFRIMTYSLILGLLCVSPTLAEARPMGLSSCLTVSPVSFEGEINPRHNFISTLTATPVIAAVESTELAVDAVLVPLKILSIFFNNPDRPRVDVYLGH